MFGVVWFHSRLGSAHARNYRGCSIGKSRPQMRQYCQGVHLSCLNEDKETLDDIRFNEPATIFAVRHATTDSSSCCSNNTGPEHQQERQQHSVSFNTYMPVIKHVVQQYNTGYIRSYHCSRGCLLYTSPSPRDRQKSRMPSSA